MSGPRFTPGPWRFRVANAAYPNICDIEAGDNYFDRTIIGFTAANCEASQANARLIAAAPELYEALKDAAARCAQYADYIRDVVKADDLEAHPYLPQLDDEVAKALAAVAKARGEL